jgi:hypothetical protein
MVSSLSASLFCRFSSVPDLSLIILESIEYFFLESYLGYLLESGSISAKSLQSYLSVINDVHNDFEYPPAAFGHLVKLARKGYAELQDSSMLQPQKFTAFPAEHMFTIVRYGLRPNPSKHHIRVCAA